MRPISPSRPAAARRKMRSGATSSRSRRLARSPAGWRSIRSGWTALRNRRRSRQRNRQSPIFRSVDHSRIGRRPEHAAARLVRTSADPKLAVGTGRGFIERDEFDAVDAPPQARAGDLFRRFTIVLAATPLTRRVAIAALVDPRIVRGGYGGTDSDACA